MNASLAALLYLIAGILFILALRGLSSPETARAGNIYGIAGMVIAVVTTLVTPHVVSFWLIIVGILIGGAIGTYIALRIQMTALPQLVALDVVPGATVTPVGSWSLKWILVSLALALSVMMYVTP